MKSAISSSHERRKSRLAFFPVLFPDAYAANPPLYNALVVLGCGAIFLIILFAGSLLAVLAVILAMFLTRDAPAARLEMGWMAIMLLAPVAVFMLDIAFCAVLLMKNLRIRKED
ncbi:MAG TPA: hypothetical protein VLM75_05560 [Spirochaetota bacterium]|nr:hypothetical protein [Spirochaetota bacterium]